MTQLSPLAALGAALGAGGTNPALTQRELARALGFALLDATRNDPRYLAPVALPADGNAPAETKPLAQWLEQLLDASWPAEESPTQQAAFDALSQRLLAVRDPAIQHCCVRFLARLGHLHQLAGHLARENLHQQYCGPGTLRSFLDGDLGSKKGRNYTSAEQAVADLNAPAFEMTFTAHPTNTSSTKSMQDLRELGELLRQWKSSSTTSMPIKGEAPASTENAALVSQIRRVLQSYAEEPVLPMQADKREPRTISVPEEVDHMIDYLANSYADLPKTYAGFDRDLRDKFGEKYQPETLKLGVKFHSWGSSGDKDGNKKVNADTTLYALAAHHAEILERYQRDLRAELRALPGMYDWSDRIATACATAKTIRHEIRDTLNRGGHLDEARFDRLSSKLRDAVAPLDARAFEADLDRAYDTADAAQKPALLHLLRQVHTFGFSFGKIEYRETAEEYERIARALIDGYETLDEPARQKALVQAMQNPVELTEKFKTVGAGAAGKPYDDAEIAPIAYQTRKRMELARDFPNAIQNQVLAECQKTSHILEALLLQHATTGAGSKRPSLGIVPLLEDSEWLKAAPSIVKTALDTPAYQAHVAAVAAAQHAAPAQQVQLAHSDNARRNGMPAARGLIYQAHEDLRAMMKNYGGIALQFYEGGSQSDPYRGGVRPISATVNEFGIHDFTKMTFQGGDLLNFLNQPASVERLLVRNLTNSAAKLATPEALRPKVNPKEQQKIVAALDEAKAPYIQLFKSPELNEFMEAANYTGEVAAGNVSSRAGARTTSPKVNVEKTRSIGYSTVFQHIGITPSWLGAGTLRQTLSKQFHGRTDNPAVLNQLYLSSPPLRDVIDRALDGLKDSDLDYADSVTHQHSLMPRFREEYAAVFSLCYEAYTGKKAPVLASTAEMRAKLMEDVFPHMQQPASDQQRFLSLARGIKREWLPDENGTSDRPLEHRLLHNALNTVYHGRRLLLDDPNYAKLYCDALEIDRPYAPQGKAHGRA